MPDTETRKKTVWRVEDVRTKRGNMTRREYLAPGTDVSSRENTSEVIHYPTHEIPADVPDPKNHYRVVIDTMDPDLGDDLFIYDPWGVHVHAPDGGITYVHGWEHLITRPELEVVTYVMALREIPDGATVSIETTNDAALRSVKMEDLYKEMFELNAKHKPTWSIASRDEETGELIPAEKKEPEMV